MGITGVEWDVKLPAAMLGGRAACQWPSGCAAETDDDGLLHPDAVAETYWQLHQQHRSAPGTHELDLRPYKEAF
jgi:hypothetical protein